MNRIVKLLPTKQVVLLHNSERKLSRFKNDKIRNFRLAKVWFKKYY